MSRRSGGRPFVWRSSWSAPQMLFSFACRYRMGAKREWPPRAGWAKVVAAEITSYCSFQTGSRRRDARTLPSWDWPQEVIRFRLLLAFRNEKYFREGKADRSYSREQASLESLTQFGFHQSTGLRGVPCSETD